MKTTNRMWKRTSHLKATPAWAKYVFGGDLIGSTYCGMEWIPEMLNPTQGAIQWITLRKNASRQDFIQLWELIGGPKIGDGVLNNASEYVRNLNQKENE